MNCPFIIKISSPSLFGNVSHCNFGAFFWGFVSLSLAQPWEEPLSKCQSSVCILKNGFITLMSQSSSHAFSSQWGRQSVKWARQLVFGSLSQWLQLRGGMLGIPYNLWTWTGFSELLGSTCKVWRELQRYLKNKLFILTLVVILQIITKRAFRWRRKNCKHAKCLWQVLKAHKS